MRSGVNTGDFFFRFLFYSVVTHILIFGYFIVDPFSTLSPKKNIEIKNAIRVDSIGLPELRQKQKAGKKKDSVEKKLPEKKKKAVKKKSVAKKRKKKAPVVKVTKKKKKPVKKDKTKDVVKVRKEQNQAINKIKEIKNREQQQNQALDKLSAIEKIEEIKKELEEPEYTGAKISKGNAQEGTEGEVDFEMLQYFTSLRAHINMYWSLPQELADKNLRAEIYTEINSEGKILKGSIMKSSGNEDFDARVLEVIYRASPLPKPPTKKIEKLLSKGVVLKFPE